MAADGSNYGNGGPAQSGGYAPTASPSQSQPAVSAQPGADDDPMIGTVIDGRYRILSKLGEGGMGEVYACEHVGLRKKMAVKLLRAEIVTNDEAVARFRQEAQSASAIRHKNIIEISDIGDLPDKRVYMCMEFLEGVAFNDLLKQPVDPVRALNILIQTCDGLSAAHRHSIIHRDMKPENIFVTSREGQEIPKLLDFGIAKVSGNDGQNNLTRTGTIFGTPFYMAPEQALGQTVDHRADIYSLGVIMYEIFTGSVPFKADSFMAILTQHITTEPKPPEQMAAEHGRSVPPGFTEIITRCMRKDPNERFSAMDELKAALVERYRALAGPGMSSYWAAQGSQAMAAQGSAGYGMPSGPQGAVAHTPMPTPMPASAPMPQYGGSTSVAYDAPKKGKGWLIAVIMILLLGGGGAGGYFYWQSQQKDGESGGQALAANDGQDGTQTDGQDGTQTDGQDGAQTDGQDGAQTDGQDGAQTDGQGGAQTDGQGGAADGTPPDATVITAPVEMASVLINSKPQGAEVFLGSEAQGKTPVVVEVPRGEQTALVLVRKGYEDAALVVDGKKKKQTAKLKRERRGGRGDKDHGKTGDGGGKPNPFDGTKPKDGPKDKPDDVIEDGLIDDDSDQLE